MKILFVCTGNICRSPTAHGVLQHMLKLRGMDKQIGVDSAGTHDYHEGAHPDERAVKIARKRGYNISQLKARMVTPLDLSEFEMILGMDHSHLQRLYQLQNSTTIQLHPNLQIRPFLDFAPANIRHRDVPDPYYGSDDGFAHVLDMIEATCENMLELSFKVPAAKERSPVTV